MALDLAKEMPNVKIYCLVPESPLAEYLPLSDIHNEQPMLVEDKPENAIKDFLPFFEYSGGRMMRFFRSLGLSDEEYLALKKTLLGLIIYDIYIIMRMAIKILRQLCRNLFHLGKNNAKRKNKK